MQPHRILIVDDDTDICEIVQAYCEKEGYAVAVAHNQADASERIVDFQPDLIVLDIMLGNENGIEWCIAIRRDTAAPIVFLSSHEEDEVKIRALAHGGDDYVTKPFSPGVLVARMKAHLRRVATARGDQRIELPGMILDFVTQKVVVDGRSVFLSKKEFGLLAYMAQKANQVVDTATLFQLIWGTDSLEDTRTVAVHISNLRKKIEIDPADPKWIVTVRGYGYKLMTSS